MKLYVAVTVRQKQRIFYRLDIDPSDGSIRSQAGVLPKHQDIEPGKQAAIGGDLYPGQVDSIIEQLKVFGLMPADEVNRLTKLTPYIYSKDRPITRAAIEKAFNHNQAVLSKQGKSRREEAAIAAAVAINSDEAKISIEQVTESELGGESIAEGYTVDKTAPPPGEAAKRRRGRPPKNAGA